MNKYILIITFIAFGLFKPSETEAQQQIYTLESSIEYAKQNSPLSRAARFAILSAKWRYNLFADLYPSLAISGDALNFTNPFSNVLDDGTITFSSGTNLKLLLHYQ